MPNESATADNALGPPDQLEWAHDRPAQLGPPGLINDSPSHPTTADGLAMSAVEACQTN